MVIGVTLRCMRQGLTALVELLVLVAPLAVHPKVYHSQPWVKNFQ